MEGPDVSIVRGAIRTDESWRRLSGEFEEFRLSTGLRRMEGGSEALRVAEADVDGFDRGIALNLGRLSCA